MRRSPNEPDNKAAERLAQFLQARESQPETPDDLPEKNTNVPEPPAECQPDSRADSATHQKED
ncbi:hypothetical protein [Fibrivirga algicola]|uniref:Uncharacterized protein n=1 Tax=Fibrivirga algicola TaxID=2950420 RepID=A0ABX0QFS3_9BACT|nr:hypothetical protein [Fibrivirga algicola]ARK11915.1 hypothetical protein A6C57_17140 [Fibrella sp. ES10-3-2-2]NID11274.1 hypothetical protein [Fibrivirga algicola]